MTKFQTSWIAVYIMSLISRILIGSPLNGGQTHGWRHRSQRFSSSSHENPVTHSTASRGAGEESATRTASPQ